ncbi:metal-dependent hydrolase [Paracoccus sp. KR1-242]|uniref:metal-dependent hydrolase n=1 Tax=Paracoccus sp. KR1-242 TaxID=3410028 RepID=UPI003C04BB16
MFIAHLPAGYLMTRHFAIKRPHRRLLILTGLCASILPDLDLLWFYLIDGRQTAHHAYLFHAPLFWIFMGILAFIITRLTRCRKAEPFIWVALLAILLHMVLDSVAAEIAWLKPFSAYEVNLVQVPARYGWWVWNFVLHWTFLLEIGIVAIAGMTLWCDLLRQPDNSRNER